MSNASRMTIAASLQIVKTALCRLWRRHSLAMFGAVLMLAQLGCKSPEVTGDNYTIGEAVVRGTVRDPAGLPVTGATISIHHAPEFHSCELLDKSTTIQGRVVTDSDGEFNTTIFAFLLAHTPSTCVLVDVKPPTTSALADTSIADLRLVLRYPNPGVVLDTAALSIVLRAK